MPNFVMDGTGLICALQGRTFEKVNPGRAIVGIYANGGGYAGPLLIAETADAVTFWTSNGGTTSPRRCSSAISDSSWRQPV